MMLKTQLFYHRNKLDFKAYYKRIEVILNRISISSCFYSIFDQINAAVVFQKHEQILPFYR